CDVAGFISNNQQDPYMRHSASNNIIQLATRQFVSQSISSLSLIQLKLQAGRKLMQAETTRLNAVLDYIDAVTATDTSTAPDV
ncbi:tail fiber assembly protein, partial [Escherichia coli]|uniref:tail fiber assembly protein n=1 Tax=Escherichia coli TaxID=562 RepID=UPI002033CB82